MSDWSATHKRSPRYNSIISVGLKRDDLSVKDLTEQMISDYTRYIEPKLIKEFRRNALEENSILGPIVNILDIFSTDGKDLLERRYQRQYEIGTDSGYALFYVNAGVENLNELLGIGESRNICPCCSVYEHSTAIGGHSVCPICLWEDDRQQRNDPDLAGGSNEVSLIQARELFLKGLNTEGFVIKNICPCCGLYEHSTKPGDYSVCPVCGWCDDGVQRRNPDYVSGANDDLSLNQARALVARS